MDFSSISGFQAQKMEDGVYQSSNLKEGHEYNQSKSHESSEVDAKRLKEAMPIDTRQ